MHHLSSKRYDCSAEPLQRLWKLHLKQGTLPSEEAVAALPIGWHHVHLQEGVFWKDLDGIQIDLSSIAKGSCVDRLSEQLSAAGYPVHYVEWSGEIRTGGKHPEGRPWRIGITGGEIIELVDGAVATSGDYNQFWTVEGTTYTHLIDPRTKLPLQITDKSIASASVQAKSCLFADAVATTLMLFPSAEEAIAWANEIPGIKVWVGFREK